MRLHFLTLSFLLVSCIPDLTRESLNFVEKPIQEVSPQLKPVTFAELKTEVLVPQCLKCHPGMSTPEGLSSYIEPGDFEKSPLFTSVHTGRMPKNAPKLTPELADMVKSYVMGQVAPEVITFNDLKAKVLKPANCMSCLKDKKKESDWAPSFTPGNLEQGTLLSFVREGHLNAEAPALEKSKVELVENFIWNAMNPEDISFEEFKATIITPYCIQCHKKMDEAAVLKNVVPQSPMLSRYYDSIKMNRMPKNHAPLSAEEKRFVRHYILKLKPQESTAQN